LLHIDARPTEATSIILASFEAQQELAELPCALAGVLHLDQREAAEETDASAASLVFTGEIESFGVQLDGLIRFPSRACLIGSR
jgi:hypothetical protein